MQQRVTLLLPPDLYGEIREEALKHRVSFSDVVRWKLQQVRNSFLDEPLPPPPLPKIQPPKPNPETLTSPEQTPKSKSETDFAILEILFLLREFLFERNGQILKKIDEKMERRFGKERKRVL